MPYGIKMRHTLYRIRNGEDKMSLDVSLYLKGVQNLPANEPAIFIRENGQTKQISRAEWDERYPNREPVIVELPSDDSEVFDYNITHNLNKMADEAGIYQHLWRPEELSITKASELIEPLTTGLALLESDPTRFKTFNPENGWGDYEGLVEFVRSYLMACRQYPEAEIYVSR
jgi:hypothetical protein